MSSNHQLDTDLVKELVQEFGKNQRTLAILVAKVESESKNNPDLMAQIKLKDLRRTILIEDVKGQDKKIEIISKVLDEICLPQKLPTG